MSLDGGMKAWTNSGKTGSNGANLSFPDALGIPDSGPVCDGQESWCESNSWIIGFVNAMPYITIWIL